MGVKCSQIIQASMSTLAYVLAQEKARFAQKISFGTKKISYAFQEIPIRSSILNSFGNGTCLFYILVIVKFSAAQPKFHMAQSIATLYKIPLIVEYRL